jgi:hypothetical protein
MLSFKKRQFRMIQNLFARKSLVLSFALIGLLGVASWGRGGITRHEFLVQELEARKYMVERATTKIEEIEKELNRPNLTESKRANLQKKLEKWRADQTYWQNEYNKLKQQGGAR